MLCRAEFIGEGKARGFTVGEGVTAREFVVLRKHGGIFAYENRCPHQGTPLEIIADRFLTRDGNELLCTTHGARFRIRDGFCVAGPCIAKYLVAAPIHEAAGIIVLNV